MKNKKILEIVDRIKQLKNLKTDEEVASVLKMTKANLSNYKTRGAIPYENLSIFCEQEGISLDWLLTGEGPMERVREERPLMVREEPAIYNEIVKLEERIDELKKAVRGGKPELELADDEIQWLNICRKAKELSPERLEFVITILESTLKALSLMPKEEKLRIKKIA